MNEFEQLKVPPHSVEAEQAVLGGLMLAPEAWPLVSDLLTPDDFYRRDHALIWRAISDLAEKDRPFDAVTLGEWFVSNGKNNTWGYGEDDTLDQYVVELASTTPSAANIKAYAEIVQDKALRRRLIEFGTSIVSDGFESAGNDTSELLANAAYRLAELQPAQVGGLRSASESLPAWYASFTDRFHNGVKLTGLPTPWHDFNEVTHGLQPSTLYLVAGRPSMGKSIVGLNLSMFTALRGHTTGLFSLEMSVEDCHNRNVAALARVPHDWLLAPDQGGDCDEYVGRMTLAIKDLRGAKLFIDDTASISVRQFEARARRMHQKQPLELLVVDHIHDFKVDPKLARFEYGQIVQVGKNLAKEWHIPVVMLGQLNRNVTGRSDRRPTLADLRESGELEQKGDVIVLLHREDYYDTPDSQTHLQGVVEMHFAKGRNIKAGGRINLRNRFDQMRMEDWEGPLPFAPAPETKKRGFSGKPEF